MNSPFRAQAHALGACTAANEHVKLRAMISPYAKSESPA
jgi:hypothetical protein